MLSASEAKKIALNSPYRRIMDEIHDIERMIKNAAEEGRTSVSLFRDISKPCIEALEAYGYKITETEYITVDWTKPNGVRPIRKNDLKACFYRE